MDGEKEPFKCEVCHMNPAKKVWYNSRDEEKYICPTCYSVVNAEWCGAFFHYLCYSVSKVIDELPEGSRDITMMQGVLVMLNMARFFMCIPELSTSEKRDGYVWVEHPKAKGLMCGSSGVIRGTDGPDVLRIRLEKEGWKKPLRFNLLMSKNGIEDIRPVIDDAMTKACSDELVGFSMPRIWLSLAPMDVHSSDEIENFMDFFGLTRYKGHPWCKRVYRKSGARKKRGNPDGNEKGN